MTDTTAMVMAITAQANSSAAMAAASSAKDEVCKVFIQTFDAKGATIEAMRTYSECVSRLYPVSSLSPDELLFICIGLALCLTGVLFIARYLGVRYSSYGTRDRVTDYIVYFFCGFFGLAVGLFLYP